MYEYTSSTGCYDVIIEKKENYVDDAGDRRGATLTFRFRTRSAGLEAEVGGCKDREESSQCVMCSRGEDESVQHVR